MKKIIFLFFVMISNLIADEILVFAAASLKYVLEDIKTEFLKNKNHKININYLASGKAYNQIINGAPAHLFIAADTSYPKKLYENKFTRDKPINYIKGKLVLISKNLQIDSINILKNDNIKHIALPNPKLAPYGVAAMECMKNANIYETIKHKIVLGESIGQATQYVQTESSDIGFSALSMVIKDENIHYFKIDTKNYKPILQALVITDYGKDSQLAKDFKDFILSPKARDIFASYGYDKP